MRRRVHNMVDASDSLVLLSMNEPKQAYRSYGRKAIRSVVLLFLVPQCVVYVCSDSSQFGGHSNVSSSSSSSSYTDRRNREIVFPFEYLTSEDIYRRLHELREEFPYFVDLTSSQDAYNLPTAGNEYDCPFESERPGCHNWIITIHDKLQDQNHASFLPEVFLSGALHGDEWVGPTTVIETVELLLEAAACEALPQRYNSKRIRVDDENFAHQVEEARVCRENLVNKGVFPEHRKWLARLVSTRRIIVVPTANALGYAKGIRTEGEDGADPNRDFPYDQPNNTDCLNTVASRTIYSLLNKHTVQLGIAFHGGMEAIAYEWGAPSHEEPAPDKTSQEQISNLLSRFGGEFVQLGGNEYPVGTMNELVYPVNGGMEDWAYAASWDEHLVSNMCSPSDNGGFPNELQNPPTPEALRMFLALVETSTDKKPAPNTLGTNEDIFTPFGDGNGHISRNIRLSLAMTDIVEPYVSILGVNDMELWDDVVPLSPRGEETCKKTKVVSVPHGTDKVIIRWTVGGGLKVDNTAIWYAPWEELDAAVFNCITQPTREDLDAFCHNNPSTIHMTDALKGKTHWSLNFPLPEEEAMHPVEAIFSAEIDLSSFKSGETVAIYGIARVDQTWKEKGESNIPPQTHLARARTDPEWFFTSNDGMHAVQGRLDWLSVPLTIEIGPSKSIIYEKSVRHPLNKWHEGQENNDFVLNTHTLMTSLFAAVLAACVVFMCVVCREKGNGEELWAILRLRRRHMLPLDDYDETANDLELSGGMNRMT